MLLTVPLDERPHFLRIQFLDTQDIVFEMSREFERSGIVGSFVGQNEYAIFIQEFAQIDAMFVVVDTQHIRIEPNLASTKCGMTFLLECDRLNVILGQHISSRGTRFNSQFAQILLHLQFLKMQSGFECNTNHFGFAIWIGGEINHA